MVHSVRQPRVYCVKMIVYARTCLDHGGLLACGCVPCVNLVPFALVLPVLSIYVPRISLLKNAEA